MEQAMKYGNMHSFCILRLFMPHSYNISMLALTAFYAEWWIKKSDASSKVLFRLVRHKRRFHLEKQTSTSTPTCAARTWNVISLLFYNLAIFTVEATEQTDCEYVRPFARKTNTFNLCPVFQSGTPKHIGRLIATRCCHALYISI